MSLLRDQELAAGISGSEWAATGWKPHRDGQQLLEFYSLLLRPILAAQKQWEGNAAVRTAALDMIDELIWGVTTLTNRARWNVRFISRGAVPIYSELSKASKTRDLTRAKKKWLPLLRHEHVVSRSDLKQVLWNSGQPALLRAATSCIVTNDEDQCLTRDGRGESGWKRYLKADVAVWNRMVGDWAVVADL